MVGEAKGSRVELQNPHCRAELPSHTSTLSRDTAHPTAQGHLHAARLCDDDLRHICWPHFWSLSTAPRFPPSFSASSSRCGVAQNPPDLPTVGQECLFKCTESQAPPLEAVTQRGQFQTFAGRIREITHVQCALSRFFTKERIRGCRGCAASSHLCSAVGLQASVFPHLVLTIQTLLLARRILSPPFGDRTKPTLPGATLKQKGETLCSTSGK